MQQAPRKLRAAPAAVAGRARHVTDIGVDVKRPVGHHRNLEAKLLQRRHQKVAPLPELFAPLLEHGEALGLETGKRRMLGNGRCAQVQILRKPLQGGDPFGRRDDPAEAPPGHSEVFRKTVDHRDARVQRQGGGRCMVVGQALVDLIDQNEAAAPEHPIA